MQMSSAIARDVRQGRADLLPRLAVLLKVEQRREDLELALPLELGDRLSLRSPTRGIGSPSRRASSGL